MAEAKRERQFLQVQKLIDKLTTLGSLTLSTQYPRHISMFCAIFEKGRALKIVKDA